MPSVGAGSLISPPTQTAEAWLTAVLTVERRGELLAAYDFAQRGLEEHPHDIALRFRAVLALARTGSTAQAIRRFAELDLSSVDSEDVSSLNARLRKDLALDETGPERQQLAREASGAYLDIRDRTHGYFPAINAATMALVAGDVASAHALAVEALELVDHSGESGYFAAATESEAYLLLGDQERAQRALARAGTLHENDFGALSTTRRQLRLICGISEIDPGILAPLAGPAVAHFCGHRISAAGSTGRFLCDDEQRVATLVAEQVRRHPTGFAYGSLASGADILWAEALLADGCELHVVLPFSLDEFIVNSVADAGEGWVGRFHQCLKKATSVTYATEDAYLNDDVLFDYNSKLAMGLALLRARYLDADIHQFALWDGLDPIGAAGTAADVSAWQEAGHVSLIVTPRSGDAPGTAVAKDAEPPGGGADGRPTTRIPTTRIVRAMVMGDVRGYSKLTEEQIPIFSDVVLGAFADVLARYEAHIEYRNTWGDALFIVLADATVAARCVLDIGEAIAGLALNELKLPEHLAIRLSGHVGPVFPQWDPVVQRQSFMGSHITRAARMEPVTPPGVVLVTEAFAAALELADCRDLSCGYVGHMPAAKDYGRLRMYRLDRKVAPTRPTVSALSAH